MFDMRSENADKYVNKWTDLEAEDLLADIFKKFGTQTAIGTSFQKTGLVIMDMASRVTDTFRAFTIDTGRLFSETIDYMKQIEGRYANKLYQGKIQVYKPAEDRVKEMIKQSHWREYLFLESTSHREFCCKIRKVEPSDKALKTLTVWITGLRKDQSKFRSTLPKIQPIIANGRQIIKVSPVYTWSESDLDEYIKKKNLPVHPLYSEGYATIGCKHPCTTATLEGEDPRKARWRWELEDDSSKKECKIHLSSYGDGSGI